MTNYCDDDDTIESNRHLLLKLSIENKLEGSVCSVVLSRSYYTKRNPASCSKRKETKRKERIRGYERRREIVVDSNEERNNDNCGCPLWYYYGSQSYHTSV